MSEAKPCAKAHSREKLLIGLMPMEEETSEETYARWARIRGINPWCGNRLIDCPEPIR